MLPFDFGHDAASLTHESLLIELPERLSRFGETVSFRQFFQNVVNETPATKQMIALAARQLTKDHEIEVLTTDRKLRRNGVIIHDDDLLKLPATKSLFLPRTFDE